MERIRTTKRYREDPSKDREDSPQEIIEYDTYPQREFIKNNTYLDIYLSLKPKPSGFSSTIWTKTGYLDVEVLNIGA